MVQITEILVPLAFFASVFGIVFIIIQARNKERMAMIERGTDPSFFNVDNKKGKLIKIAMFIIGAGIGLVSGTLFSEMGLLPDGISQASMLMIFAGTALLGSHFLVRKLDNEGKL